MTYLRLAGRAGALVIPIILVVAACSGSTASSAPSGGAGSSAAAGASITPATPPSAATGGGPSAAAQGNGPTPSFDLGALTAGLKNLDSYKAAITIGGTPSYTATVVNKPVFMRDLTIPGDVRIVTIGEDAWVGTVGGPLKASPGAQANALFAGYDPTLLLASLSGIGWAQSAVDKGTEQKNGVSAKHYHIDGTTLANGFSGLPPGSTIDAWIADQGYLAAVETTGWPGGELSFQVTNVNDPANKVDHP